METDGFLDRISLDFIEKYVLDGGMVCSIIVASTAVAGFYTAYRSGAWSLAMAADRSKPWGHYLTATLVGGLLIATAAIYARLGFGERPPGLTAMSVYLAASLLAAAAALLFTLSRRARRERTLSGLDVVGPALAGVWLVSLAVPLFRMTAMIEAG